MKHVMLAEPSTIVLFGMGFLMLLLLILLLGATIFLIVHFSRKTKKPPPPPALPAATAPQIFPRKCPQCGAELKPDVSEGLCPACLLLRGIATEGGVPPGTPPFVPPTIPDLAKLFPQLEILEIIGKGGMGAVYKARQPALDRFVALKILAPRSGDDRDFAGRFTREARALAKLSHPNIVGVYDFGRAELPPGQDAQPRVPATPVHYFIMEYVDGPNLRQIEQAGKLTPREALEIIPQICAALQFAHDEGIVHRDIKPENVLLDKKGRVKIADFGLAKILGPEPKDFRLTGARDVVGTPHYMAPEQVEKPQEVDHRADIYSLGVVFYEMLTGELPLGKFQPPSNKVRIDVRLDEVVLHALEKEPERRYQQASQVKTAVETIAAGEAKLSPHPPVSSKPDQESVRHQVKAPATGLLVVGILNWILIPLATALYVWGFPHTGIYSDVPQPGLAFAAIPLTAFVLCTFIIYGALQMMQSERRGAAIAASVLAIIITPGNLIGLPLGIWALVVLNRREVRNAFAANRAPAAPRASRTDKSASSLSACTALFFAGLSGVLGITVFCLFPQPPVVLVWSILIAALAGVALGVQARQFRIGRQAIVVGAVNTVIWLAVALAVNSPYFKLHQRELEYMKQHPGDVIAQTIQHEVGRQLREAGATYDDLQAAVAIDRDSATPYKVVYRGLHNFKGADDTTPAADGEFILEYIGAGQWEGKLAGTKFTVTVGSRDNIDLPFVNDPQVLGNWQSVDFVTEMADFNPDKPRWPKDRLFLKGLTFLADGVMPQSWLTWTKGYVMHHGDQTASRYEIREIKGNTCLFFEWKSGDVTIGGMKPRYYVLKKSENTP